MKTNNLTPRYTDEELKATVERLQSLPDESRDYFNIWTPDPQRSLAWDLKHLFPKHTARPNNDG